MPAAYDTYDYPSYWETREYEHKSEALALKSLLSEIPKIETIIDIGAGYGRLTSIYAYRAKKIILTDPSSKLLKIARERNSLKKVKFIHASLENLGSKIRSKTVDLIIFIRVIHHIKDLEKALTVISKLSKKNSYFILEFPNKRHVKETVIQFLKGNFNFLRDLSPKDIRSKKSIKKGTLPFVNYHPDYIEEILKKYDYKILKTISVSNLRYTWIKENLPLEFVMFLEYWMQKFMAYFHFGPSMFVLAKKK